jgi:hypothetical protein
VRVQREPAADQTQRECIEEAYIGATVPRFRAETQRVLHVLRP